MPIYTLYSNMYPSPEETPNNRNGTRNFDRETIFEFIEMELDL